QLLKIQRFQFVFDQLLQLTVLPGDQRWSVQLPLDLVSFQVQIGLQVDIFSSSGGVGDVHPAQVADIRMGRIIVSAKIVAQGFGAVQLFIPHDTRSVYNAAPYFLHVAAFYIIQFFIPIRQRRGRGKQRRSLSIGQVVVFEREQNVLPHDVLIGVVQNLLRRLGQQPVPELLLFRKHLLVKGGVPLFIGHLSGDRKSVV